MRTLEEEVAYQRREGYHRNTIERTTLLAWLGESAAQAEKIRVLREVLPKVMNYASCEYDSSFRSHFDFVIGQARTALKATK